MRPQHKNQLKAGALILCTPVFYIFTIVVLFYRSLIEYIMV